MSLSDKEDILTDRIDYTIYYKEDVKKSIKKLLDYPSKSLELTALNLCGCSQDDVWEAAINWFKNEVKTEMGDKLL